MISAYLFGGVVFVLVTSMIGGVVYIDRSATARHEKNALVKAIRVQRRSVARITSMSTKEVSRLNAKVAESDQRAKAHRNRAAEFEAKLAKEKKARTAGKIKSPKKITTCTPGCTPRWNR